MTSLRCLFSMSALVFMQCMAAQALTGNGDSEIIALETVAPRLESVEAVTPGSITCTFNEPMLVPGVVTAGNWVVSGLGVGTLAGSPDTVSGTEPYALSWPTGEMRNGVAVSVTATGLQDAAGNPIAPAHAAASTTGLGTVPVFSALSVTPGTAGEGDAVTITFAVSEPLDGEPAVTVNGHGASWISGGEIEGFSYSYTVQGADTPGMATVTLSGSDPAGNLGTLSNSASLEVTPKESKLPLSAWPAGLMLLAAGALMLRRLRKSPWKGTAVCGGGNAPRGRGRFLLALFALGALACSAAFAALPEIRIVTVTQGPDGSAATKVDIYYDLTAPNGPCDITVLLSKDGGADGFIHSVTAITGDVAGVATGTGKHLVWNIAADYPNETIPNARIRVIADDHLVQHALAYGVSGGNGTVSGIVAQTVNDGTDGSAVLAVADAGYHFVQWSDGILTAERTDTNVTGDITVTATFEINTYDITCSVVGSGSCIATPATVNHGSTSEITVAADAGYRVGGVTATNGAITGTGPYTLSNVTADTTVTATFVKVWTVTYVTIGCTISGGDALIDDTTGTTTVKSRASVGYKTPFNASATNGTVSNAATYHTLSNVTADTTFTVEYTKAGDK